MPGARKSAATRRIPGTTNGSEAEARAGAKAPSRPGVKARAAGRGVAAKTRRSTSLQQLQAELRRAEARIAALEAVLRVTPQGDVTIAAAAGLTLQAAATVGVEGSRITLASMLVEASDVLRCQTLLASSVVASSYTPGAGNLV